MKNLIISADDLATFEDQGVQADSLKENPHFLPLYLLHYFRKKYSSNMILGKEESTYYSRKSAFCRNCDLSFPKEYSSWFIATTRFDHVNFFFQFGLKNGFESSSNGFAPFANQKEYPEGLKGYINIQVFSGKIKSSFNISNSSDLDLLLYMSKIGKEIIEEMQKYGLSFSKGSPM